MLLSLSVILGSKAISTKGIDSLRQTQIPLFLQPDVVNLLYFQLRLFELAELIIWNIKGQQLRAAKIKGLDNLSL